MKDEGVDVKGLRKEERHGKNEAERGGGEEVGQG